MPAMPGGIKIPTIPRWMQRRLGMMVMVLLAAITINFAIPRMMPGDISDLYTTLDMSPDVAEAIRKQFGLDQPLGTQFLLYLKNTFTLQFGTSFFYRNSSVGSLIGAALPRSLLLLIPAQLIQIGIAYILGVIAGWKAGSKRDSFIMGTGLVMWAMPLFWIAMVVLYVGSYSLGWFPIGGYKTVAVDLNWFETILDRMYYLILPTIAMVTQYGASALVMRNTMTITLKLQYILTAKGKGLSENRVKHRHAARNAMIPLVTSTAMRMAMTVSGMIFVEKIFSYPGMGKLIFDAVLHSDYPVLQAGFLLSAVVVLCAIFILDLVYARLDPRVRYE